MLWDKLMPLLALAQQVNLPVEVPGEVLRSSTTYFLGKASACLLKTLLFYVERNVGRGYIIVAVTHIYEKPVSTFFIGSTKT